MKNIKSFKLDESIEDPKAKTYHKYDIDEYDDGWDKDDYNFNFIKRELEMGSEENASRQMDEIEDGEMTKVLTEALIAVGKAFGKNESEVKKNIKIEETEIVNVEVSKEESKELRLRFTEHRPTNEVKLYGKTIATCRYSWEEGNHCEGWEINEVNLKECLDIFIKSIKGLVSQNPKVVENNKYIKSFKSFKL